MNFPVVLSQVNGHFSAHVLGSRTLEAEASTRELAIEQLRTLIRQQIGDTEMISLQVDEKPMHPYFGIFKDDPTVEEFIQEYYRQRDEQRIAEHGE